MKVLSWPGVIGLKLHLIAQEEIINEQETCCGAACCCWQSVDQSKVVVYGAIEGPQLTSPANGATGVSYAPTVFKWKQSPGIDTKDIVGYTLEYTDVDPTAKAGAAKAKWKTVALATEGTATADAGGAKGLGFALFGACGMIALVRSKGARRYLAVILLVALSGAALVSCGGDDGTVYFTSKATGSKAVVLEPNTTYWWRVIDTDKNGGSTISETYSFTTKP